MTSATSGRPCPDRGIALPDLDESGDADIVAENVRAMGPIIVAAMLEELELGQVVDRIVEQFERGALPIGTGGACRPRSRHRARMRIGRRERRRLEAIVRDVMSRAATEALRRLSDRAAAAVTAGDPSAAPAA